MLKKKALTAVLTAAFVLGIGGLVTEPVSTHEHGQGETSIHSQLFEPAVAHADRPVSAVWKCYWCGTVREYTRPTISVNGKRVGSKEPKPTDGCPNNHLRGGDGRHGWVWVSGDPPVDNYKTYYRCQVCNIYSGKLDRGDPPVSSGCINHGKHVWQATGIVVTW